MAGQAEEEQLAECWQPVFEAAGAALLVEEEAAEAEVGAEEQWRARSLSVLLTHPSPLRPTTLPSTPVRVMESDEAGEAVSLAGEDERTDRPMDRGGRTALPAAQQVQAALLRGGRAELAAVGRKRSSRCSLRFSCPWLASRTPPHSDSTSRPHQLCRRRLQASQRTPMESMARQRQHRQQGRKERQRRQ